MSSPALNQTPGTCYKFVVGNANEAAQVIRDRLGDNARVLSVRTLESKGLLGMFGSPKIEVIAVMTQSSAPAAPAPAASAGLLATSDEDASPAALMNPVGGILHPDASVRRPSAPARTFRAPIASDLATLLRRSGYSETVMNRLEQSPAWANLKGLPLHRALVETNRLLCRMAARTAVPLHRAAFIGLAGSGRTTALCKWIGTEVSRRAKQGHVVAAEFDQPLSRGSLPIFCEALGVPFAHFPASTQPAMPGGFVYLDLPPMSLRDASANAALAGFLDREQIAQRVLVLNAVYGAEALRAGYARGRELGATHVVFTHLDERPQWGGLWDYILDGGLEPLFLSTGPSLTGECEDDVCAALARRTLPGSFTEEDAPAGEEDAA